MTNENTEKRTPAVKCVRCLELKPSTDLFFPQYMLRNMIQKNHQSLCKLCKSKSNKRFRASNKEYIKAIHKSHYIKNKEYIKLKSNQYYAEHKDERMIYLKNQYWVKRNEPQYAITRLLRARLYRAVVKDCGCTHKPKTLDLLGCSVDYLRKHLESLFTSGMSWKNRGRRGWHVDHIIPCDYFDLTKLEEQKKCFHWTNLQPLWWHDNIRKSNKILI